MKKFVLIAGMSLMTMLGACGNNTASKTQESKDMTTTVKNNKDVDVAISTTAGDFTIRLYGDTPKHRDNFIKLVNEGFYNGTLFHRVINEFMVQAGDPDSKGAPAGKMLGGGDPGYTIEAEFDYPNHFHKRGALAAARTGDQVNPEKRSSGSQFYVVTGKTYSEAELDQMEKQLQMAQQQGIFSELVKENREKIEKMRAEGDNAGLQKLQEELIAITETRAAENPAKMPDNVRETYKNIGGTPFLDGNYTVFGEVIEGMDVIEKIEKAQTDRNDRPNDDIKIISMKIV